MFFYLRTFDAVPSLLHHTGDQTVGQIYGCIRGNVGFSGCTIGGRCAHRSEVQLKRDEKLLRRKLAIFSNLFPTL